MATEKSKKKKIKAGIRIVLLLIILCVSYWAYDQFSLSFQRMELSNRMIEAVLANKMELAKKYAAELGITRTDLLKTETILAQAQKENAQLREQVKLVSQVSELETTISRLKEKNATLVNQIGQMESSSPDFARNIKTLDEGHKMLAKYKEKLQRIKGRISEIKHDAHLAKVEVQKEKDRLRSLVGNNGYTMRNGTLCPMDMVLPPTQKNVNIEVQFVK